MNHPLGLDQPITETEAQARARLAGTPRRIGSVSELAAPYGVTVLHPHEDPYRAVASTVAGHDTQRASLEFARQYYPHPEDALFHEGAHARPMNWAWALLAAGLFIFAVCFALELSV